MLKGVLNIGYHLFSATPNMAFADAEISRRRAVCTRYIVDQYEDYLGNTGVSPLWGITSCDGHLLRIFLERTKHFFRYVMDKISMEFLNIVTIEKL